VNITLPDNLVNNMLSDNCKSLDLPKVQKAAIKAATI